LRLYELSKPTIAIVNGPAAAAGAALACACDIRVASERAVFVPSFVSLGMSGDWGATFFFRQLLGPSKARELFFTDRRIAAAEALALGLVDHVYPHDSHLAEAMALARVIAAQPRHTIALMKQVFRVADTEDIRHVLALEGINTVLSSRSTDGRVAMSRFLARRRATDAADRPH
jgi:2-(1,2-epoxy-1,2-dihydrophenyl)acetyl-CoA isomerase